MQSIGDPIKSPTLGAKNHAPLRIADLLSSTNSSPESRISDCAQVNWQISITPISEAVTQSPSHSISCSQSNDERNAPLKGRSDGVQFRKSSSRKRSSSARSNPQLPLQPKWPCRGGSKAFSLESSQPLASKSNYERIIEGSSTEGGLLYPKNLSSELRTKQIKHMRAEKSRRDRMKKALDDLAGLLPHPSAVDGASGIPTYDVVDNTQDYISHSESTSRRIYTDKVTIVERAAEYIRELAKELAETRARFRSSPGKDLSNGNENTLNRQGT